jgi:hypothetical protein
MREGAVEDEMGEKLVVDGVVAGKVLRISFWKICCFEWIHP